MTYEQAIIVLKKMKKDMFPNNSIGANALDLAIEALQKQIPMKPIYKERYWYLCPICESVLSKRQEHCDCGQRIDWSDEE